MTCKMRVCVSVDLFACSHISQVGEVKLSHCLKFAVEGWGFAFVEFDTTKTSLGPKGYLQTVYV